MRKGTKMLYCPSCGGNRLFEKLNVFTKKVYKHWRCMTCGSRKHEEYRHWKGQEVKVEVVPFIENAHLCMDGIIICQILSKEEIKKRYGG